MSGITVRPLAGSDVADALEILVDVFVADPSWQRVFRSRRIRPALTRYYRRCLQDLVPAGNADGAWDAGRLVGVALWYPPGQRPGGLIGRITRLFSRRQREHLRGWLLEGIAVAPDGRGQGTGGKLLTHRLAGCTDVVHLEATTEASARLYARFGFVAEPGQGEGDHGRDRGRDRVRDRGRDRVGDRVRDRGRDRVGDRGAEHGGAPGAEHTGDLWMTRLPAAP